jgi:hypothetical protein
MQVQYQLTAEDFWQFTLVWRRARPWRKWAFRILPAFCAVFLGLICLSMWQNPKNRTSAPVAIFGVCWVIAAWARPRIRARRVRETPSAQAPVTMQVSDGGIEFSSAVENSQVSWPALTGWVEGKTVFALFFSSKAGIPIPKTRLQTGTNRGIPRVPAPRHKLTADWPSPQVSLDQRPLQLFEELTRRA